MKYLFGLVLLLILFLGNSPTPLQACSFISPPDYTIVTEDGNYTFVMLNSDTDGPWVSKKIRSKYTQPGLYANNSTNPVWIIQTSAWYSFTSQSELYASSDGKYLVKVEKRPWIGLAFYENGKELKRYKLEDLGISVPQVLSGSCPKLIDWVQGTSFDEARGRFMVDTANDRNYEFDITTGQIINISQIMSKWKLMLILFAVIVGILLVLVGPVVFGEVRKNKLVRQRRVSLLGKQAGESINPWIIMYIKQNSPQHSRYEIDRYLLEANCNPAEIEAAWREILIERL